MPRRLLVLALGLGLIAGLPVAALAQSGDFWSGFSLSPNLPPFDLRRTDSDRFARPATPKGFVPPLETLTVPLPYAPPQSGLAPVQPTEAQVLLEAKLTEDGAPVEEGVVWRIFSAEAGADGEHELVATAEGGTELIALSPGSYLVHAAFGRAGAVKRLTLGHGRHAESFVLEAGGLRLGAVVGDDHPIPAGRVTFEVLQREPGGESRLVVADAALDRVLRLKAGTYHVVSRYGGLNAVVRADIQVAAGKLTEAVVRHRAAEVTLKLVAEEGGEAFANTSWAVLTEAGDALHESVGAFPRIVLAEGAYTAVARHKGRIYAREFRLGAGLHREVEVRLSDLVRDSDFAP